MIQIAVFVSGGGTNLQALIDAEQAGKIHSGRLALVVASKPGVYALERAEKAGIPSVVVSRKDCAGQAEFEAKILAALEELDEAVTGEWTEERIAGLLHRIIPTYKTPEEVNHTVTADAD